MHRRGGGEFILGELITRGVCGQRYFFLAEELHCLVFTICFSVAKYTVGHPWLVFAFTPRLCLHFIYLPRFRWTQYPHLFHPLGLCLEEELKYPVFTGSTAWKRRSKVLEHPSQRLFYNSGLYILFINLQISFFPKRACIRESLYLRGLITAWIFMF